MIDVRPNNIPVVIRLAEPADARQMLAIFAPLVVDTAIWFALESRRLKTNSASASVPDWNRPHGLSVKAKELSWVTPMGGCAAPAERISGLQK